MTALVVPLAMTTRMEVIRRNKVRTLIAGLMLASMIRIVGSMSHALRTILAIPTSLYRYPRDVVHELQRFLSRKWR